MLCGFVWLSRMKVHGHPQKTAPVMGAILNGLHDHATEHNGYFPTSL